MENKQDNPNQELMKKWQENGLHLTTGPRDREHKFYCLDMFPYPSGSGLHAGHVEGYAASDILSRYMRMEGYDVLHPMGWDSFGLPAENFAIKTGVHPAITTDQAIETFKGQMNSLGFSYDWDRELQASLPRYYKWTQWFFLLLYKNGLAYKKKGSVNWCDSCQTVLANEQAEGGSCERCNSQVVQKDLEQWYFKITDFVEDTPTQDGHRGSVSGLISGLDKIDWPESTKAAQRNWIGRSEGVEFDLAIAGTSDKIRVYTTRIDTVYGLTYVVLAPEHQLVSQLVYTNKAEVTAYVEATKKKTELERQETKEKTGIKLEGVLAENPFTKESIPVFVADYVLNNYGTGAVMAVPAHDERDFEFAKKYGLPIRQSVAPLFVGEGDNKIREDKPDEARNVVDVIVRHWEKDEYYCLDWKFNGWKSFVVGGIENGETLEVAAMREVTEETGYKNVKAVRQIGGEIRSRFYAAHKEVNRKDLIRKCVLVELTGGEHEMPLEEHTKNHDGSWISKDKVANFLTLPELKIFWDIYQNGDGAYPDDGIVIESGEYSGLSSAEAREKMGAWLEKEGLGKRRINYRLRDWLVSRQRYWGAPIPIIYCDVCGEVPVPESDLPVELPLDVDFKPTGESPLNYAEGFRDCKCPKCGAAAKRECDTMDTFVCSSWYYFRFADPMNSEVFAAREEIDKWLPVDVYIGGAEHTVLHLLYSRFFTKVLRRYGFIGFDEPFLKLRHQGTILAEDGTKMSKSKGNVVNPDEVVKEWGPDAMRLHEMFLGAFDDMKPWNTQAIAGVKRFLDKLKRLSEKVDADAGLTAEIHDKMLRSLNKTIKIVGEDIRAFKFNTAISQLMIQVNEMGTYDVLPKNFYEKLLLLLAPLAPFTAEEMWEKIGNKFSIHEHRWPEYDESMIVDTEIEIGVQINGKIRGSLRLAPGSSEAEVVALAKADEKIGKYISGDIKKVIFVKDKILSFIV